MDIENKSADVEQEDPWALPELKEDGKKWSELDSRGKALRVLIIVVKTSTLLALLYLFICSLSFLSSAFRLLGGKAAGRAFAENKLLSNPIAGLMIGVLVTVLVQSSSTSTSIVVAMVAGDVLKVKNAIYIIMGANIGTTVTNTIVSIGQSVDRDQFRRAFAAATVHDMFNFLSVLILLPLEAITGYLYYLSNALINAFNLKKQEELKQDYLKKITKPFTDKVIKLDKKIIEKIARATTDQERQEYEKKSMIQQFCKESQHNITYAVNVTASPLSNTYRMENRTKLVKVKDVPCNFLFHNTTLSDNAVGGILLFASILLLCVCLVSIVKLLHSMFKGRLATLTRKVVNTDFPKPFGFLTGYVAIIFGAILTFLVQSSSIFTSAMTPLVGVGVISLDRMYPLTLGSNIGTTTTAILASFAADASKIRYTLQVSLCHLFFNISGILIWYPVPVMRRIPIKMAKSLGNTTARYRWFAIAYIFILFFIIPGAVFGLSIAGLAALLGVGIPTLLFIITIFIINILQEKRPQTLPSKFRTWDWAPAWTRSLEPYDRVFKKSKEVFTLKFMHKDSKEDNSYESKEDKSHENPGFESDGTAGQRVTRM